MNPAQTSGLPGSGIRRFGRIDLESVSDANLSPEKSHGRFPLTPTLSLGERESKARLSTVATSLDSPTDCGRFSLSPSEGERVGVRGRVGTFGVAGNSRLLTSPATGVPAIFRQPLSEETFEGARRRALEPRTENHVRSRDARLAGSGAHGKADRLARQPEQFHPRWTI